MKADYPWQRPYEAAILETHDTELLMRLSVAKAAIDARLEQLRTDHGGTPEEHQAIADAIAGLNILGKELKARTHESA